MFPLSKENAIAHKLEQIERLREKMENTDDKHYHERVEAQISLLDDMIVLLKPKKRGRKKRSD